GLPQPELNGLWVAAYANEERSSTLAALFAQFLSPTPHLRCDLVFGPGAPGHDAAKHTRVGSPVRPDGDAPVVIVRQNASQVPRPRDVRFRDDLAGLKAERRPAPSTGILRVSVFQAVPIASSDSRMDV